MENISRLVDDSKAVKKKKAPRLVLVPDSLLTHGNCVIM